MHEIIAIVYFLKLVAPKFSNLAFAQRRLISAREEQFLNNLQEEIFLRIQSNKLDYRQARTTTTRL